MSERLLSVGLDVGTTTTQLVVSELTADNRASAFSVPRMEITERKLLYESPVHFTPLLGGERVDGQAIRRIVEAEYAAAGIRREDVDTGAVIITGETSRKENAAAVLQALSDLAGDFVVATAGPDLESLLAAKGSGAVAASERTGKTVLHMDIGGGTSNLALIRGGNVEATSCVNVGGRLLKFDENGRITYVSPVLDGLVDLHPGQTVTYEAALSAARLLAQALEMAAGLRPRTALLDRLMTAGAQPIWEQAAVDTVSFSGGVADCIDTRHPWLRFGDLGPLLGQAIRESALCRGQYRLGSQTIRATVIGAGCHSVQLSGSTIYRREVVLPIKSLPVAAVTAAEQELGGEDLVRCIKSRLAALDQPGILHFPGWRSPSYERIRALAAAIAQGVSGNVFVALEADMAKALGHALALLLPKETPCLCIDGIHAGQGSYLDIGQSVGPALQVVVKTVLFSEK